MSSGPQTPKEQRGQRRGRQPSWLVNKFERKLSAETQSWTAGHWRLRAHTQTQNFMAEARGLHVWRGRWTIVCFSVNLPPSPPLFFLLTSIYKAVQVRSSVELGWD